MYVAEQVRTRENSSLDGFFNRLEEHESNEGIPVRVLDGAGDAFPPTGISWTDEHRGDFSQEDADENGQTFVMWGTCGFEPRQTDTRFATGLFIEGHGQERYYTYGTVTPQQPNPISAVYRFGSGIVPAAEAETAGRDTTVAELLPRTVLYRNPFMELVNYGSGELEEIINWDNFLYDPMRLSRDPEVFANLQDEALASSVQTFLSLTENRGSGEIDRLRQQIDVTIADINDTRAQIDRMIRTQLERQQLLDAAMSVDAEQLQSPEQREIEFNKIVEHALIDSVIVRGNTLYMYTKDIELTDPTTDRTTIVGQFQITIDLSDGGEGAFKIRNLTNRKGHHDHPHVSNGDLCMGEFRSTLLQLMQRREYGAAVNLLMTILQTVTPSDDWGRHVAWWFMDDEAAQTQINAAQAAGPGARRRRA
jgi:hypothetical protein